MISRVDLKNIVIKLKPMISKYNSSSEYGPLSFFEVYTAIAFVYFFRQQVDFVVLETGMGGRLDATNTVNSWVCGITPISLEHTQKLGKTLGKIAKEKAGIIKPEVSIVISAAQKPAAAKIIRLECKKSQTKLLEVGRQLKYFKTKDSFLIQGLRENYKNLKSSLIGDHQMANATLAVGLVETLKLYGFEIDASIIRQGVLKTIWPGRCEVVGKHPLIVLDGAQNLASAQILKTAIKDNFKYNKLILVLGISDDKDIAGICKILEPLANEIILTRARSARAAYPEKLSSHFKQKVYLTVSVKEAKLLAKRLAGKKDLILVTGSLFVVGEYRDVKK
jgi:dihydrofolate synthase/folylpolyglutamate synthase